MSFWRGVWQGLMEEKWITLLISVKWLFALLLIVQLYGLNSGLESEGCRWALHEIENTSKALGEIP